MSEAFIIVVIICLKSLMVINKLTTVCKDAFILTIISF
jgi:hypothetical protein